MKRSLTHVWLGIGAALVLAGCPSSGGDANGGTETESGTDGSTGTGSTSTSTSTSTTGTGTSTGTSTGTGGCGADADCDNGVFCDGAETCVDGSCVAGDPVVCDDDGIDCTKESCNTELDKCVHTPDHSLCGCGESCSTTKGCGDHCVPATCNGMTYQCGDCLDNDNDCGVDFLDTACWGPCDDNEEGWDGDVPGQQNQSPCLGMDCYFDFDSGPGNDDCYWSHACDPMEPSGCTYNENHGVPGTNKSCADLEQMQSPKCLDECGPLTPNGCDCFGCCDVVIDDQTTVTVYLGSGTENGPGTCDLENATDPTKCYPCTKVEACLNTCEHCELCIGKLELPRDCEEQECPRGFQQCGLAGQEPCPEGQYCNTGCCFPNPQ